MIFRKMRAILAKNMEINRHISLDWIIENILKYGDSFIVVLKSRHYSGNTQQVYDSMIQSVLSAYGIKSTVDTFDAHEPTPYNSILAVCKYLIIRDPLTRYTINISGNIDDFTDDIITLATVFGYKVVVNSDDSIPTINIGQFVTMFMSNGVWFGNIHPRPMEAIPIIRSVPKDGMSILNFSIAMVIVSDKNYDGEVPRPKINIGNVLNLAEKHPCKFNDMATMIVLNAASQVVILNNNSLLFTDRTNNAGYKVDMHYNDFFLGLSVCPVTHKIVMSATVRGK